MLATSAFYNHFVPSNPSPLAPRSANIHGSHRRPGTMASSSDENASPASKIFGVQPASQNVKRAVIAATAPSIPVSARVPFAQRQVKVSPLSRGRDLREQRRGAYLRRVNDGREEKRFAARGDDMMRSDFLQRQREWKAEQARMASTIAEDFLEDEDEIFAAEAEEDYTELPTFNGGSQMQISSQMSTMPLPEEEVDDFLRDEDRELEALLEFMPGCRDTDEVAPDENDSDGMWSDDVDYDELFSHVLSQQENIAPQMRNTEAAIDDGEEMDVT